MRVTSPWPVWLSRAAPSLRATLDQRSRLAHDPPRGSAASRCVPCASLRPGPLWACGCALIAGLSASANGRGQRIRPPRIHCESVVARRHSWAASCPSQPGPVVKTALRNRVEKPAIAGAGVHLPASTTPLPPGRGVPATGLVRSRAGDRTSLGMHAAQTRPQKRPPRKVFPLTATEDRSKSMSTVLHYARPGRRSRRSRESLVPASKYVTGRRRSLMPFRDQTGLLPPQPQPRLSAPDALADPPRDPARDCDGGGGASGPAGGTLPARRRSLRARQGTLTGCAGRCSLRVGTVWMAAAPGPRPRLLVGKAAALCSGASGHTWALNSLSRESGPSESAQSPAQPEGRLSNGWPRGRAGPNAPPAARGCS